jgi:hypothetical protein
VLLDVSVTAKKDITIDVANLLSAPDAIRDVQHYYRTIDERPHTMIGLLTFTKSTLFNSFHSIALAIELRNSRMVLPREPSNLSSDLFTGEFSSGCRLKSFLKMLIVDCFRKIVYLIR